MVKYMSFRQKHLRGAKGTEQSDITGLVFLLRAPAPLPGVLPTCYIEGFPVEGIVIGTL